MSIKRAVERYVGGGYKAEPMSDMFWGLYREKLEAEVAANKAWDVMEEGFKQERAVLKHEPDIAYREGFIEGEARGIDRAIPVGRNDGYVEGFKKGFYDAIDAQHKPFRLYDIHDKYRGTDALSQVRKIEDLTATLPDEKRFWGLRETYTYDKGSTYTVKNYKELANFAFVNKPYRGLILLNMEKLFSKEKHLNDQLEDIVEGTLLETKEDKADIKKAKFQSQIEALDLKKQDLQEGALLLESEREINEDKEKLNQIDLKLKTVKDEELKTSKEITRLQEEKDEVQVAKKGAGTFPSVDKKSVQDIVNIVLGEPVVTAVEPTPRERVPKRRGHDKRASAAAGHHAQVEEIIEVPEIKKPLDKFDLLDAGVPGLLADNPDFVKAVAEKFNNSITIAQIKEKGSYLNKALISAGLKLNKINRADPQRFNTLFGLTDEELKLLKKQASEAQPKKSVGQTK